MVTGILFIPIKKFIAVVIIGCAVWLAADVVTEIFGKDKPPAKIWKVMNITAAAASVCLILYATLFARSGSAERTCVLMPFDSIRYIPYNWSIRQEKLVNLLVFVPFGLSFPRSLPDNVEKRALLGLAAGFSLSFFIELTQYIFALGMCETDDVIVNTLGTLAGVLVFAASCKIKAYTKNLN